MKASDVITQLQSVLPRFTDRFSDEAVVTSLTRAGAVVTAVTATPHGMQTGDRTVILNAKTPNTITSLTSVDGVATAVTASAHDLTRGYNENVETVGANEADYNGTHKLIDVPSRFLFTYEIDAGATATATGTPEILETFQTGYNGLKTVTVIDLNTFTYGISTTPQSPAQGNILSHSAQRISGAISAERALSGYTKQVDGKFWGWVVIGDVITSKDRNIFSDATNEIYSGIDYQVKLIMPFSFFVAVPATNEISGRKARDDIDELVIPIYRSLLGVKFPSDFAECEWSQLTPTGHGFQDYNGAYYIHRYDFEHVVNVTFEDTTLPDGLNVAFRDIDIDYLNVNRDNNAIIMESNINLDDSQ